MDQMTRGETYTAIGGAGVGFIGVIAIAAGFSGVGIAILAVGAIAFSGAVGSAIVRKLNQ